MYTSLQLKNRSPATDLPRRNRAQMVRTIRIQNSRSGIVRLNRRDLRLVLSARISAIILVSGPACPRCTALKRALLPLLQERGFTIFEAGYFDAYATLSPEELKKYHLPRVYSFPTLILAGGDSSAPIRLTYGAEGVEGLVDALLKNVYPPTSCYTTDVRREVSTPNAPKRWRSPLPRKRYVPSLLPGIFSW